MEKLLFRCAAVGAVGFGLAAIGVVTMTMGLGIIPLACVGFTVVVLGGFFISSSERLGGLGAKIKSCCRSAS